MAQMTIAQLRERTLDELVKHKTENPTSEDYAEARKIMNSYYRLVGLCERNLYLSNDERWHDKPYTKQSEEKEDRWYKRLDKQFSEIYGLRLVYCSYYPSIGKLVGHGGFAHEIFTYFYN